MTNANENTAPLSPETPKIDSIAAYYNLRNETMSFEDAMKIMVKELRLKTNPLKLNMVREQLGAAETYGDFLSVIREQEDDVFEHDMSVLKMTTSALKDASSVKMQLNAFNAMVNDFQEITKDRPDVNHEAIEYAMDMFRGFLDSVETNMVEHIMECAEDEKNQSIADQYEGTSKTIPDTVEELLGESENK